MSDTPYTNVEPMNGVGSLSGKVFNRSYLKDTELDRKFYTGKDDQGNKFVFTPAKWFKSYEVSAYLNRKFGRNAWGDYVTDSPKALKDVVKNGLNFEGQQYVCIFAAWSDKKGKAILVHEDAGIESLKDIGVNTKLSHINESMKAAKYLKRLFAPGDMGHVPVWGKELEGSWREDIQECIIVLENGHELSVRYIESGSLNPEEIGRCDGHIGLSERGHRELGLTNNPKIGDSWRVTVNTQRKYGKGHTIFQPNQETDVVIYLPKKHVSDDGFCFMSMGPLHAGTPYTDIQSVTNFKLYKLVLILAINVLRHIYISFHSATGVAALMAQILRPEEILGDEGEELEQDVAQITEKWTLRRILSSAVSFFAFPGSYRRAFRHVLSNIKRFNEWRIPMNLTQQLSVATSKYMSGEPSITDEFGMPDMSKCLIQEGEICIMDLPAGIKVVIYRRPNENSNAFVVLTNVHHDAYKDSVGKSVAFLGRGVHKVMARLGGGDMDDNIVILTHPKWVEHFATLSYPETDKLVPVESGSVLYESVDFLGDFDSEAEEVTQFEEKNSLHQIDQSTDRSVVNIGTAVNADMIDMICSDTDNKVAMVNDLIRRKVDEAFAQSLLDRTDWTTAFMATNLEIIIDAAVKDPGYMLAMNEEAERLGSDDLATFIRDFHKNTMVYPYCMKDRIPEKRKEAGGYVLAISEQCAVQIKIAKHRKSIEKRFAINEYRLARKADPFILGLQDTLNVDLDKVKVFVYGRNDERNRHIKGTGLRDWWGAQWKAYQERVADDPENASDNIYSEICGRLDPVLNRFPEDFIKAVAIEIYRFSYFSEDKEPNPDHGEVRPYSDGLLWTNRISNAFLDVLQENNLLGEVKAVSFFARHYLATKPGIPVRVANTVVYTVEGDKPVGRIANRNANGIFTMSYGLIRFKKCDKVMDPKQDFLSLLEIPELEIKPY